MKSKIKASLLIPMLLFTFAIGCRPSLATPLIEIEWLTAFEPGPQQEYVGNVIAEYEALHPDVDIKISSPSTLNWRGPSWGLPEGYHPGRIEVAFKPLLVEIADRHTANIDPDVMTMSSLWMPGLIDTGIIAEPPPDVQADVAANWTDIAVEAATYKYPKWGYPEELVCDALVYNKRILNETGITPPEGRPWTWEELKNIATAVTTRDAAGVINRTGFFPCPVFQPGMGYGQIFEGEHRVFAEWLWSNGGEEYQLTPDREVLFNSSLGVEVYQFWQNLNNVTYDSSNFPSTIPNIWWNAWVNEEIVMTTLPDWMGYLRYAMGERFYTDLRIAPIPTGPHTGGSCTYADCWLTGVSKKAKDGGKAEAAWNFLRWINEPRPGSLVSRMGDLLVGSRCLPSRRSDQENSPILQTDFWLSNFTNICNQYGRVGEGFQRYIEVEQHMGNMFEDITSGEDPRTALDATAAEVEKCLPIPGDINGDDSVDIFDIVICGVSFGAKPGDSNWDPRADINGDGLIDIFDLVSIAINFGRSDSGGSAGAGAASAEATTLVSVCPSEITVGKYESFSVNVTVTNATNLYGYEFKLYYDRSILNCTGVTFPSDYFLKPVLDPGNIYIVKQEYNNAYNATHGCVWVAAALMSPEQPRNGSGTLATITFKALAAGTSTLNLQDIKLSNMEAEAIPVTAVDGSATVHNNRYMRSDQHSVNGLTAYNLGSTQSSTVESYHTQVNGLVTVYWGTRVWVRHADGNETELTSGTPVAQVSRSDYSAGLQSGTWNCSEAPLATTDAIVIRIYMKIGAGNWIECAAFTTAQLKAQKLENSTWTIYYYTKRTTGGHPPYVPYFTEGWFTWGTTTGNSHIENFNYT